MSSFSKSLDEESQEQTAVTVTALPSPQQLAADTRQRRVRPARRTLEMLEGMVIGDYVVEGTLGAGGCGHVYGARHRESGEPAAIKVLRPEMVNVPTVVPRFIREVEALSRITHDNIVKVFAVGEVKSGLPYYVMERLEGMDVRQMLKVHQRLSPREALAVLEPAGDALTCAHEQGIIHRDIKASNIFVCESEGKRTVKLLDFGIAKLLYGEHGGDGLTAPGTMIGTPHAMAPEQIRCEPLDCRADIYSLGVLLFLMVTGKYPFNNASTKVLTLMHLQTPAPRPSESASVSAAIDEVVLKCMAKSPGERYGSVSEFIEALRRAVGDVAEGEEAGCQALPAVGIRLEVGTADDQELDDEMIEDIAEVLDIVEGALGEYAFDFPLRASNALTAVRLLEMPGDEDFSVERAEEVLSSIKEILDEREEAHPDVVVSLSLREGPVECRKAQEGMQFVGGALLDAETWPAGGGDDGN